MVKVQITMSEEIAKELYTRIIYGDMYKELNLIPLAALISGVLLPKINGEITPPNFMELKSGLKIERIEE